MNNRAQHCAFSRTRQSLTAEAPVIFSLIKNGNEVESSWLLVICVT